MPRFFFDVHDHVETIDDEGIDLADEQVAVAHAIKLAPRVVNIMLSGASTDKELRISARAEDGQVICDFSVRVSRGKG